MASPAIFIGSSSEGLEIANKLQVLLAPYAEVTIWSQGVYGLSTGTLETLVSEASNFDFAVLVLTPDDLVVSRGEERNAPRDNVLFELGLFMGTIGRNRTFVLASDSRELKLPSDLAGITTARYPAQRADGNLLAALGPAATQITDQVKSLGRRNPEVFSMKLRNSEVCVRKGSLLDYVGGDNAILLPANVYFDTTAQDRVVDARSTLGKRLALFSSSDELAAFDKALDEEIKKSMLTEDKDQRSINKPGRQTPYQPGSIVVVDTQQGPVALLSLTRVETSGSRYISTLDEEALASALRLLWKNIVTGPIRGDLYMPVVGSGFGGITRPTALIHVLLSYRAAEAQAQARMCNSLNIIVYHDDWGDGGWVRHLFEGLMS